MAPQLTKWPARALALWMAVSLPHLRELVVDGTRFGCQASRAAVQRIRAVVISVLAIGLTLDVANAISYAAS